MMVGKDRYQAYHGFLNYKLRTEPFLIAAHRGCRGGGIVENSLAAYQMAFLVGADIAELDVTMSADGKLYAFHDGTENYNLGIAENLTTKTAEEIDVLTYYNNIGLKSGQHVECLEYIVSQIRPDQMYNIDRINAASLPATLALFDRYPVEQQLILKTYAKPEELKILSDHPTKYMYMPIVDSMEEVERVLSYDNINVIGVEIMYSDKRELLTADVIARLHERGLLVWANALTMTDEETLFSFGDDNRSLLFGPSKGWERFLTIGIDVIQTDWSYLLAEYRRSRRREGGIF